MEQHCNQHVIYNNKMHTCDNVDALSATEACTLWVLGSGRESRTRTLTHWQTSTHQQAARVWH